MSDFEDDSDDLVRRAMNGSDLDSTGPSDDDSDDTSLDSDDASFLSLDSVDIPLSELVEETNFIGDEDADAFRGLSRHAYRQVILPLKLDEAYFLNYNFHSQLSEEGRERLGYYIALADAIRQIHVTLTEEEPAHLGHVFRRPQASELHALRRLKICRREDSDASTAKLARSDWESMCMYLKRASSLQHLDLTSLNLNSSILGLLTDGLSCGIKLKTLGLKELDISDDNALGHMLDSLDATRLETVDIVLCKASVGTCTGLTSILQKGAPKLQSINVVNNSMNDQCVKMLCAALAKNTTVTALHLDDNDDISKEGLEALEKIVFDTTSLANLYSCNHTLANATYAGVPPSVGLDINWDYHVANKRHCKIARFVTNHNADSYVTSHRTLIDYEDHVDFNVQPFAEYEIEMIPYILDFFANRLEYDSFSNGSANQYCVYELIRKWIVQVFSFPSAERVRLNAKMAELEGRIDKLESKNRGLCNEVEALRAENERLALENDALKSRTGRAGEGDGNAKKRGRPGK
ncbi:hypothetical protein ACHAXT_009130 [Thalassiosira profunda]